MVLFGSRQPSTAENNSSIDHYLREAATADADGVPPSHPAADPEERQLTAGEIALHALWRMLNIYSKTAHAAANDTHYTVSLNSQLCPTTEEQKQQQQEHQKQQHRLQEAQKQLEGQHKQQQLVKRHTQQQQLEDGVPLSEPAVSGSSFDTSCGSTRRLFRESHHLSGRNPSMTKNLSKGGETSMPSTFCSDETALINAQEPGERLANATASVSGGVSGAHLLPLISPESKGSPNEELYKVYVQLHEVLLGLPPPILVSVQPSPHTLPQDLLLYNPTVANTHLCFPRGPGNTSLLLRQLFLHVPLSRREQAWLDALHRHVSALFRPLHSAAAAAETCAAELCYISQARLYQPAGAAQTETQRGGIAGEQGNSSTGWEKRDSAAGIVVQERTAETGKTTVQEGGLSAGASQEQPSSSMQDDVPVALRGDEDDDSVESLQLDRRSEDKEYGNLFQQQEGERRLPSRSGPGSFLKAPSLEQKHEQELQPYPLFLEPTFLRLLWLIFRSTPRNVDPPLPPTAVQSTNSLQQHEQQRWHLPRLRSGRRGSGSISPLSSSRRHSRRGSRATSEERGAIQTHLNQQPEHEHHWNELPPQQVIQHAQQQSEEEALQWKKPEVKMVIAGEKRSNFWDGSARACSNTSHSHSSTNSSTSSSSRRSPNMKKCRGDSGSVGGEGALQSEMSEREELEEAESLAAEAALHVVRMAEFRRETFPLSDRVEPLQSDLQKGVMYWCGRDIALRPVLVINLRRLDSGLHKLPRFLKLLLFVFEWGLRFLMLPGKVETCVALLDVREVSLWKLPYQCLQSLVQTLTREYPFRLRKLFVLHDSRLLNGLWNLAKVFLTDVQQAKVAIFRVHPKPLSSQVPHTAAAASVETVNDAHTPAVVHGELHAQMLQLIPPSQLEETYGGKRKEIQTFYPFPIPPPEPVLNRKHVGACSEKSHNQEGFSRQNFWMAADALTAFGATWDDGCRLPVQWNTSVLSSFMKKRHTCSLFREERVGECLHSPSVRCDPKQQGK